MPNLLSRLAGKTLPAEVPAHEVPEQLDFMAQGWVPGAVPPTLKGKTNYGEQPPALALAITDAGWKALGVGG